MVSSLKEIEDRIIDFWEKEKIYEKVKKQRKKAKKFYFLDGPPYATGSIHVGTAMNKVLKDCFIRFFRMRGFNVWDQPGYDTHGVPIENKVEKLLNFKSKEDIEKFGVEKFIAKCREFATKYIDVMGEQFKNLGVWMDWENPYLTLTNDYIEGAWFTFKEAFEKGFLYKGNYTVHVCPHCETAVAYNEIVYTKLKDVSIYVKFKLKDKENEYLVIWTTTPWTLPSNTGVMAKPNADYVKVKVNDEVFILAKELLETVMNKLKVKDYKVLETVKGKDLEGLNYVHPLEGLFPFHKKLKNACRVVLSEQFVSLEEGTGLVHCAPGHGQEDFKVGVENGLPVVNPLKMNGTFNEESGKFAGIYAKDADKMIMKELEQRKLLLLKEEITHDYPLCWRCDTPLLMMAVPQWFFKVTEIREDLIKENERINWVPKWAGQRFKNWLENLGDWPISRQRYWGIPLPIWVCEKCGKIKVIGSKDELSKVPKDFHKPYIDEVVLECECGGLMRRVPDVLDVWFDSGVCSWASLSYPSNKELFEKWWPADFILEGPDQIRGWWNSLMITSMITFGRRPFENVLLHGFVMDAHGKNMSKSRGNVIQPEEVIDKYGRDILRFFYLSSPPWNDFFFKWEDVEEIAKNFVVIRNTFNFVKTYVTDVGKSENLKKEDRWLLSKLNGLIKNCTEYFNEFLAYKAAQEIQNFILNDFSRWYIKIIRDRVWPEYEGKDKEAAFYTLLTTTQEVIKLLAPFSPFLTECVYQNIVKPLKADCESVHMFDWPSVDEKSINKKLEEEMSLVKQIVESSYAGRQKAKLKLRWPVKQVVVVSDKKEVAEAINELKEVLLKMCNTNELKLLNKKPTGEFSEVEFDLGSVLVSKEVDKEEALIRELTREIQSMRKKNGFNVKESISLTLNSDERTNKILKKYSEILKKEVGAKEVGIGKLEGKYKGSLQFEKTKVDISFSKK